MFKFKKEITICADKKYAIDIEEAVKDIKVYGAETVCVRDNMVFDTILTKYSADKVAKIVKSKLYKTEVTVVGNIVFVDFK